MKTERFRCPSCGGSHFGTTFPDATGWVNGRATRDTILGEPLRHCHDEFEKRCRWKGPSSECMEEYEIPDPPDGFYESIDASEDF